MESTVLISDHDRACIWPSTGTKAIVCMCPMLIVTDQRWHHQCIACAICFCWSPSCAQVEVCAHRGSNAPMCKCACIFTAVCVSIVLDLAEASDFSMPRLLATTPTALHLNMYPGHRSHQTPPHTIQHRNAPQQSPHSHSHSVQHKSSAVQIHSLERRDWSQVMPSFQQGDLASWCALNQQMSLHQGHEAGHLPWLIKCLVLTHIDRPQTLYACQEGHGRLQLEVAPPVLLFHRQRH